MMKPRQEGFQQPMFDIQVDLDEISLNINNDQVNCGYERNLFVIIIFFSSSIRTYSTYLNFKIILIFNQSTSNITLKIV